MPAVKHTKVATIPDDPAFELGKDEWNDGHVIDWAESGDLVTQAFGDAAATGSLDEVPRADHKHGMPANPITAHEAAGDPHTGYLTEAAHTEGVHTACT